MDDERIISLFQQRSEDAVTVVSDKYGSYCSTIAGNILPLKEDVEECVNDTWLHAWNAIPPHTPANLAHFLGKITRELSINRYKGKLAQKRGGGEYDLALDELEEFSAQSKNPVEEAVELELLGGAISRFLRKQPVLHADVFLRRYYHLCPIRQIAEEFSISESKVKSILFRVRKKLRSFLESEDLL